jgi:hypothetical protein
MKMTIEATDQAGSCPLGAGQVWVGKTSKGTPIIALISGLHPGSDDPKLVARFERERASLPKIEVCSECGEPMEKHLSIVGERVRVDLYEVMARIIIGSGLTTDPRDEIDHITEPSVLADIFRDNLADRNREQHDRLYNAAVMVMEYIEQSVNAQTQPMDLQVAGHA